MELHQLELWVESASLPDLRRALEAIGSELDGRSIRDAAARLRDAVASIDQMSLGDVVGRDR